MERQLLFFELIQKFLFASKTSTFPYYVLSSADLLPVVCTNLFSSQIIKTYLHIFSAFLSPHPRVNRQRHALQLFDHLAPSADARGPFQLFLVISPPHPNSTVLRLSLSLFHPFVSNLFYHRFTNNDVLLALRIILNHIHLCTADYLNPERFQVPLLPGYIPRDNMADPPPPPPPPAPNANITLSPVLPVFHGDPEEDVKMFLIRLDRLYACYPNLSPAHKLLYLENQCADQALSLVHRELQFLHDNPNVPDGRARTDVEKYTHVRDKLETSFRLIYDSEHFRDLLLSRVKTDGESFQQYVEAVLNLCKKANVTTLPEILKHLHKGLPMQVAACLRATDFASVSEFLEKVQQLYFSQRAAMRAHSLKAFESFPVSFFPSVVPPSAPVPPTPPSASHPTPGAATDALLDKLITKLSDLLVPTPSGHVNAVAPAPPFPSASRSPSPPSRFDNRRDSFRQSPRYDGSNTDRYFDRSRFNNFRNNDRRPFTRPNDSRFPRNDSRFSRYDDSRFSRFNDYRSSRINDDSRFPRFNNDFRSSRFADSRFSRSNRNNAPFNNPTSPSRYSPGTSPRRPSSPRRNSVTNPSYRSQGSPTDYAVPHITRRQDAIPATPSCKFCNTSHAFKDCPVYQSLDPKNAQGHKQ